MSQLRPELSLLTPGQAFRELLLGPLPDALLNELPNYVERAGNYAECYFCTAIQSMLNDRLITTYKFVSLISLTN